MGNSKPESQQETIYIPELETDINQSAGYTEENARASADRGAMEKIKNHPGVVFLGKAVLTGYRGTRRAVETVTNIPYDIKAVRDNWDKNGMRNEGTRTIKKYQGRINNVIGKIHAIPELRYITTIKQAEEALTNPLVLKAIRNPNVLRSI